MMAKALTLILWAILVDSISASSHEIAFEIPPSPVPFTGGYQHHDGIGYYKFYALPSAWGYAWKQCKEDGGHLVVIDSDEENKIVRNLMKEVKEDVQVYIGAHDIFIEGWYFTVTGNRLLPSSYNRWRNGVPNDSGRDCVVMNANGELENTDCDDKFYFICEAELK